MTFTLNQKQYQLTTEPQTSPKGRQFVNVGVEKDLRYPDKWVKGVAQNRWILTFKYLDNNEYFRLEMDYDGSCKLISKQ